jgi:hypothetical protein
MSTYCLSMSTETRLRARILDVCEEMIGHWGMRLLLAAKYLMIALDALRKRYALW